MKKAVFWGIYLSFILAVFGAVSAYIIVMTSFEVYLDILKGGGVTCLASVLAAVTKKKACHLLAIGSGYFFYVGLTKAVPLLLGDMVVLAPGRLVVVESMPYVLAPMLVIGYFVHLAFNRES